MLPAARAAFAAHRARFVRTARHPAVVDLAAEGLEFTSFDASYDAAADFETLYAGIVEVLIDAAAEHGEVVYAVPGSPAVAERTVELLHGATQAGRVRVEVVPGLSFADATWARIGVDPMATGARVLDGRAIDPAALGAGTPLLIAQCDDQFVLGDVKLALLEHLPPETVVTVVQRVGLPDEYVGASE